MKLLLASAFVSFSASAGAADWRVASTSGESIAFVDAASVKRVDDKVEFWRDWRMSKTVGFDRALDRVRADCSDKSFSYLAENYYLRGEVVSTTTNPQLKYAPPGSITALTIERTCLGRFLSGTITDLDAYAAIYFFGG